MMEFIVIVNAFVLIYFSLLSIGYTILLIASFPDILLSFKEAQHGNIADLINREELAPITIITPAYNAQDNILNTVFSILNNTYKNKQIIIVNHGSTDNTLQLLIDEFSLYEVPIVVKQTLKAAPFRAYYSSAKFPTITVIDIEHQSNSGAEPVNAGLNACRTPLFVSVDADTVIESEALTRIMFTFLSRPHCIAVGGAIYVLNENKVVDGKLVSPHIPRGWIASFQVPEYLRSFLFGRTGWNALGGSLVYPGAFSFFETQAVKDVDGFEVGNFSYDAEIVVKLHDYMRKNKYPYSMFFSPNTFAWTVVPPTLKRFWIQRNHWQRGLLLSFYRYQHMLFRVRYGVVGSLTYPFFMLFEVYSSVVEFFAYAIFVVALILHFPNILLPTLLFALVAWGYMSFLTIASAFLNLITFNKYRKILDTLHIMWLTSVEMFGFRQFRVLCNFIAFFQYFINRMRGRQL